MRDINFSPGGFPFSPINGRSIADDRLVLRAVQTAFARGVAHYSLPKWIKQQRQYLANMYEFDPWVVEEFGLEYVWTVILAYMLARTAAARDTADYYSPYLPFALESASHLDEEHLLILHTAAYGHALLYPVPTETRRYSATGMMADALMVYAIRRLSKAYTVAEHFTPSMITNTMFAQEALEARTNLMRWCINVMSVSTGYVVVPPPAPPRKAQRKRPKSRRRPR